jgi:flagellar basal-body rod protein FlgF
MERGSYVAASAGLFQFRKLEIVNNNLANLNTPGFKREMLVGDLQSFDETLAAAVASNDPYAKGDHDRAPGTVNVRAVTDFSQGPIRYTGNGLDVALREPNDFFVINTDTGPQYTRAGNFTLTSEGQLVTVDGFVVNGDGGAIEITGPGATIAADGSVSSGGVVVGKVQVVKIPNPESLERAGNSRFTLPAGQPTPEAVEAEMVPQSLEQSNVTAISSVIEMITAGRAFDLYSRSAQSIDAMNQTAITQIGRR